MKHKQKLMGALKLEALRLARLEVKDAIVRQSHYKASDITKVALELLKAESAYFIRRAKRNLKKYR